MSTPANALEHVLDSRAENDRQERLIAALDTPEIDSAVEVAWLITDERVRRMMLTILGELQRSNRAEGLSERNAAGILDRATRRDHRERLRPIEGRLTVRAAANLLRPLLLKDRDRKPGARWDLLRAIDDCSQRMDPAYLTGKGMRGELGAGPHDQLLARLGDLTPTNDNGLAGVNREAA